MSRRTDEQLLADHIRGDPEAFRLIVTRHSRELYDFVFRFTRSSAAADDVVQESFLQVHVSADRFDLSRRFKPWLFTIGANKARDWLRARSRQREVALDAKIAGDDDAGQTFLDLLADQAHAPGQQMDVEEKRRAVRRGIDRLPPALCEALVLAYFHQFTYKEMAEILDIPLGTVKSRLHAAVGAFGRALRHEQKKGQNLSD
ncbi:MAG: RNA polymerase sigma factor [Phycisphaerales bacterium]|nr:MAG: RNA polymerase sigma factor [Phycisphaerales bacterium]